MNRIAQELDDKLSQLPASQAGILVALVQKAIKQVEDGSQGDQWPEGYFEQTAGAFANEPLERAPQGEPDSRESW